MIGSEWAFPFHVSYDRSWPGAAIEISEIGALSTAAISFMAVTYLQSSQQTQIKARKRLL